MSDLSDLSDKSDAWGRRAERLCWQLLWRRSLVKRAGSTRVRQPIQNNRKNNKSHHSSLRYQQERWGSGGRNLLLKATNVLPRCGTLRRRIKKSFRRKAGRFFNHSPQFPAAAPRIPRATPPHPVAPGVRGCRGAGAKPPCKATGPRSKKAHQQKEKLMGEEVKKITSCRRLCRQRGRSHWPWVSGASRAWS